MTRRGCLRGGVAALAVGLLALGRQLWRDLAGQRRPTTQRLPQPERDGVVFLPEVILVRRGSEVVALSRRCPHLGCRIGHADGASLVCACHGSRFDLAGRRSAGPARADLTVLPLRLRGAGEGLDVDVPT